MEIVTIGGKWVGHYVNEMDLCVSSDWENGVSHSFPITATFEVTNGLLTGKMVDEAPVNVVPFRKFHELSRSIVDERTFRNNEKMLERFPDMYVRTELPANALLEGVFDGTSVEFIKSYQGDSVTQWKSTARDFGIETEKNPKVHYSGRVVEDGIIEGKWQIREKLLGAWQDPVAEGTFRLTRG